MENLDVELDNLGKRVGLALEFDEHGQCLIALDKQLLISLKKQNDGLTFCGMLREVPQYEEAALFKTSISLNLELTMRYRSAIVFDDKTNVLMVVKHFSDKFEPTQLEIHLNEFANVQKLLLSLLNDNARQAVSDCSSELIKG